MEINKIYQGDCIDLMKKLEDNSIDCIITDPPYGINKDRIGESIIGDDDLKIYYAMLKEAKRVLKKDSWLITFTSIRNINNMFKNNPFKFEWLVYIYYRNMQRIRHIPIGRSKCDAVMIFKNGNPKRHYAIWDINEVIYNNKINQQLKERLHPTAKIPESLFNLIRFGVKKDGIVLDPFAGSGATLVACKELGIKFIGFELDKNFVKITNERLNKVK